ncbi:hypothetical protein ACH3XW_46035 [Acanthocheilonema viteae]
MSSIIIRTADQTKRKLCDVLDDIKRLNLDSNNQMTTTEETIQSSSGAEKNHPRKNHAYPNLYRSVGSSQYRVEIIHPADLSLNQEERRPIPSDKTTMKQYN